MSPRTRWISSVVVFGTLVAVGLYVRSPEDISKTSAALPTRERANAPDFVPVADEGKPATFSESDRGERLVVALDEVCLRQQNGRETIARLDPPATTATIMARLKEFGPQFEALPVAYPADGERNEANRAIITRQLKVRLPQQDAEHIAGAHGLKVAERPAYAPDWVIMDAVDPMAAIAVVDDLRATAAVASADVLVARKRFRKALTTDTLIGQQWHLSNSTTSPSITHANVEGAWGYTGTSGVRGYGIRIGIVDDGVQTNHQDLGGMDTTIDKDWNGNDSDPNPEGDDDHGTAVAGVAGAVGNNDVGVSGVAPEATLVGLRLIGGETTITDFQEAEAMDWRNDVIQIKSNSWGPNDYLDLVEAPGSLAALALKNAAETGRNGKGTIFVWAAGNGKLEGDGSNYDGYANSIYTIAVGATDSLGRSAYYSENGANVLICAPSSGSGSALGVVTTDRTGSNGYNPPDSGSGLSELPDTNYTKTFGGTSSATPVVSGVVALMLQKNPNLGWRDVQEILIRSATEFLPSDPGWHTNGGGLRFNQQFGAGLVNATAAVNMAASWTNLPEQVELSDSQATSTTIPNLSDTGVTRSFVFPSTTHRVEHVTVTLTADHGSRGNLDITLTSPSGMVSQLASVHDDNSDDYNDWTFSSVHHWGESAAGTWTLRVSDRSNSGNTSGGTLSNVTLTLYGSSTLPVNPPPQVAITSPTSGQQFSIGSAVNVQVAGSDIAMNGSTGVISKVELLLDGSVVASDAMPPYQFTVSPAPGTHSLVARATDSEGGVSSSAAVAISLLNRSPVITAASLSASALHYADQPLSVSAVTASDPEGSSLTYAYQWQWSTDQTTFADEPGKTAATLPASPANAGKLWRCVITAADGVNTSVPFTTVAVNLVTRPQTIVISGSSYQYASGLVLKGEEEPISRRAIINEFSQGPLSTTAEWIELLVLQSGSLAGFQLSEADGSVPLTFSNDPLWSNVSAGTLVVIYRGDSSSKDPFIPAVDTDVSDRRLVIASNTEKYFSSTTWIVLGSAGDSISLRASGTATPMHSLCFGSVNTFPLYLGQVSGGRAAYFAGGKDLDANTAPNWGTTPSTVAGSATNPGTGVTPGAANSPANQSFITRLRTNTLVTPAFFRLGTGSSLPGGLTLNPETGVISGTVASGNAGDHPVVIERYNSLGEVVSQHYMLTVAPANYPEWIGGYDVASSGAGDDPDFDGLPNLVEYMLGLDPNAREGTQAIAATMGNDSISLTYRQSKLRADGTLVPQWATGLDPTATWQTNGLTTEVLEENEQSKLLKVSLPVAPADEKRFLRLRAATNP